MLTLLADKPDPSGETEYTVVASKDFRTDNSVSWKADEAANGYTISSDKTNGLKVTTTISKDWEVQFVPMNNIVMGKLYTGTSATAGKGIRAKGSNIWDYTTFDSYYQLSDVVWGGNKIDAGGSNWPGTFKSRYTTPEMYTDPDNHDFTLLHYLDAGDPRWKIEDTGDDGGDE